VQATWNLLETSAGRALADAKACGCGVIVKEVLANGRLTSRNGDPRLRELDLHARMRATTLESLAVAAALAQPWADVVLSGAVTCAQLQTHLAALAVTIDEDALPQVAEPPDDYWERRAALPWI
jgi:aryl-alcohol dehydrogenase-like predicted oxidoreductase